MTHLHFRRSCIWDHLQRRAMHSFPGKRYPRSFLGFLTFLKGQVSLNSKIGKITHLHFLTFFHLRPFATLALHRFPEKSTLGHFFIF